MKAVFNHKPNKQTRLRCEFDIAATHAGPKAEREAERVLRADHEWFIRATKGRIGKPSFE